MALLQPAAGAVSEAGEVGGGADHVGEHEGQLSLEPPPQHLADPGLQPDDLRQREAVEVDVHRNRGPYHVAHDALNSAALRCAVKPPVGV